jgi:hypothetical protein
LTLLRAALARRAVDEWLRSVFDTQPMLHHLAPGANRVRETWAYPGGQSDEE